MQTLIVVYKTLDSLRAYPAMRSVTITEEQASPKIAYLRTCQWNIVSHRIDEDGMTAAQDEAEYRSLCRSERRRCS